MILETFVMKTGDTLPALEATLIDGKGNAVVLTDAAVALHVSLRPLRQIVLSMAGKLVDAAHGKVKVDWTDLAPSALLTTGVYYAEWQVTFSDDTVVTFPNDSYFVIRIVPELS